MRSLKGIILFTALPFLFLSIKAQVIWEGDVDSDWENNDNWGTGLAPEWDDDVTISPGPFDPVIQSAPGSPAECNSLSIDAGVTLTITGDGALNVYTDIDNYGDIVIEDNGILWQEDGYNFTEHPGSSFSLSRTGIGDPLKFNMFSSPVAAQNTSAFSGNSYSFNPAVSTLDPADDGSDPGWAAASGNMIIGKGYACAGCGTVTFSGTPNYGNQSVAVEFHNGPGVPYNLIGNPYPAPLDINAFYLANNSDLETDAVYLWDNAGDAVWEQSDYATVNSSGSIFSGGNGTYTDPYGFIPTGQGFFVEIGAGTDNFIDFTNAMRGDGNAENSKFYKQEEEMQRIWLGVADNDSTVYNELLLAFTDNATTGYDKKYDAKKLAGNKKLSLYSVANDRRYAIQGLPTMEDKEAEVPIGVSLDSSNAISFSLKWEERLEHYDIYLKDNLSGTAVDLRKEDYSLAVDSGAHNSRFRVVITPKASTGINYLQNDGLSITYNNGIISIMNMENESDKIEHIRICDLAGKKINEWNDVQLKANEVLSFSFEPANSGYYIVDVMTGFKSVLKKICVID